MPYYVAGLVDTENQLIARTPEVFEEKQQIAVHTRHEAVEIDPANQRVAVVDLETGAERWQPYDQLLLATGAAPVRPSLPGIEAANVHLVHNLVHGTRLRQALDTHRPARAVIVGGGYIGLEMAEALRLQNIPVVMVQRSSQVMTSFDSDLGARIGRSLEKGGVELLTGETLVGFEQRGDRVSEVITDRQTISADLVILGLGVTPNSQLAAAASIALGPHNSIKVDRRQQTDSANIWAAGDCAQSYHLVSGQPVHLALGTVANRQGRVAGMNLGGSRAHFPGVLGTAITKFCDTECGRTGLNEYEIRELGLEYVSGIMEGRTLPRYYPGSQPLTVKVLAEKESARLLGVQIVGGTGSAKRIDTAATALQANFTLEDLLYLDLSYAPPFSGVWDPIVIAARLALKKL